MSVVSKFSSLIILGMIMLTQSACDSTSSIPYKASVDNIVTITERIADDKKVGISSVVFAAGYEPSLLCRMLGDLDVGSGKSIPEFIRSAFQEELFAAGRYDPKSTNQLELKINKTKFSSVAPAYWEIGLSISSPSFSGYSIEKKHNFKTSFNAWSACDNSASAFSPAVQSALRELVIHPNFPKLAGQ